MYLNGNYETLAQIAKRYHVGSRAVLNWIKKGKLEGVQFPGLWLIETGQLEDFQQPQPGPQKREYKSAVELSALLGEWEVAAGLPLSSGQKRVYTRKANQIKKACEREGENYKKFMESESLP